MSKDAIETGAAGHSTLAVADASPAPATGLGELPLRLYARALDRPYMTVEQTCTELGTSRALARQAVSKLHDLRLIKYVCLIRGRFAAVSPEAAQMELTAPLELTIKDARRELAGLEDQLLSFSHAFNERQLSRLQQQIFVTPVQAPQARTRLVRLADSCTEELLITLPARLRDMEEQTYGGALVLELLQRGVRARILCPHTARGDASARGHLSRLAAAGAEIRTCEQAFAPVLLFDGEAAYVPEERGAAEHGAAEHGRDGANVAITYEPTLVRFLCRVFDRAWEPASGFEAPGPGYGEELRDDLKQTILELLASGLKDDVVARRVGMSSRTFRRHIAAIMQELGAGSRFQAGVEAARWGLIG